MNSSNHADKFRTSKQVLNLAAVMRRIQDDMELFRDFVRYYEDDAEPLLKAIDRAIEARDGDALHRASHTLKGLVCNVGGEAVEDAAYRLEIAGKEDDWSEVEAARDDLHREVERLDSELQAHRQ